MVVKTIVVGGVGYEVCFNTAALYRLEALTEQPTEMLLEKMRRGLTGTRDMVHILAAALEGARVRQRPHSKPMPWVLEDVFALLDEAGGPEKFFDPLGADGNLQALLDAWRAAFPQAARPGESVKNSEVADPNQRPTVPTDESTGTSSSAGARTRVSVKKSSGARRSAS